MRHRKRVLKEKLLEAGRKKEQLSAQGRQYPEDMQQRWYQMLAEYKEIKKVLPEMEAAEQQEAQAGHSGSSQQHGSRDVIDLT